MAIENQKKQKGKLKEDKIVRTIQNQDADLRIPSRGRTFEGTVIKKFPKRVVLEFNRTVYVQKYERFYRKKTKLHARLPDLLASSINVGDYIKVQETRPLSKIIHFVVLQKIRSKEEMKDHKIIEAKK